MRGVCKADTRSEIVAVRLAEIPRLSRVCADNGQPAVGFTKAADKVVILDYRFQVEMHFIIQPRVELVAKAEIKREIRSYSPLVRDVGLIDLIIQMLKGTPEGISLLGTD